MEKRLLLSMVLCLLLLLVYQSYVEKQNERWRAARQEMEGEGLQEAPADDPAWLGPEGVVPSKAHTEGRKEEEELGGAPQDVRCEEVVVDTPLYRAVFCSSNGRPMRWTLKNYQLHKACECPVPGLRKAGLPHASGGGDPAWVERVHVQGPEEYPLDQHPHDGHYYDGDRQRDPPAQARRGNQQVADVGGDHEHGAVGQVEYPQQVEDEGEAEGHQDIDGRQDHHVYACLKPDLHVCTTPV